MVTRARPKQVQGQLDHALQGACMKVGADLVDITRWPMLCSMHVHGHIKTLWSPVHVSDTACSGHMQDMPAFVSACAV